MGEEIALFGGHRMSRFPLKHTCHPYEALVLVRGRVVSRFTTRPIHLMLANQSEFSLDIQPIMPRAEVLHVLRLTCSWRCTGKKEAREHVVGEGDPLWTALRGKHLAAACLHISAQMDEFRAKNQAATYYNNAAGTVTPLDSKSMKSLTASLPQYRCESRVSGCRTLRWPRRSLGIGAAACLG